MFKFFKDFVGVTVAGLNDLPYTIGEPYSSAWGSWLHHRGSSKDDGSPISIFSLAGSNAQDGHLAAGRNGVKRLRAVRHPNILSFLHSTEIETFDGGSSKVTIYIVTEPAMPLSDKIKELGLEGAQRDEYYARGLHQIAKAVSFLNNDCKLIHGNVCLASVVVTQTLDWKLHAFDVLSEFDGSNEPSSTQMLTNLEATEGAGTGSSSIPANASLLGWAMSSFTLKGKPFDHAPVASVSSSALTPTSSNASLVVDTPSTAPICVNSTPDFSEHHASTSTDDWGELENGIDEEPENDKGAWEDLEPLEETKPTPALTNIQAAQRPPVSQPVSQTIGTSLRPKTTPKMCKDEDDDLCGASAAPAPKTSKPLNLKSTAADAAAARDTTAAPAPTTRAKPLLAGRCRGAKPAAPKLGAQRIIRTPSGV